VSAYPSGQGEYDPHVRAVQDDFQLTARTEREWISRGDDEVRDDAVERPKARESPPRRGQELNEK